MGSNIYRIVDNDGDILAYVVRSIRNVPDITTASRSVAGATARAEDDIFFRMLAADELTEAIVEEAQDVMAINAKEQPDGLAGTLMLFGNPPNGAYFVRDEQGQMTTNAYLDRDEAIRSINVPDSPGPG